MPSRWGDERDTILKEDIQGLKYFRKLWPLFERLRDVGRERDKAGNRELFMDQYCALVLLFLFKEHEDIVVALDALAKAAQQENKASALQFAEKLKLHAKTEEEVLYPAAILVGEYIKLKLNN